MTGFCFFTCIPEVLGMLTSLRQISPSFITQLGNEKCFIGSLILFLIITTLILSSCKCLFLVLLFVTFLVKTSFRTSVSPFDGRSRERSRSQVSHGPFRVESAVQARCRRKQHHHIWSQTRDMWRRGAVSHQHREARADEPWCHLTRRRKRRNRRR